MREMNEITSTIENGIEIIEVLAQFSVFFLETNEYVNGTGDDLWLGIRDSVYMGGAFRDKTPEAWEQMEIKLESQRAQAEWYFRQGYRLKISDALVPDAAYDIPPEALVWHKLTKQHDSLVVPTPPTTHIEYVIKER